MSKTAQTTFRFRPDTRAWVEYIAGKEFRTMSQQIEKMLIQGIDQWKQEHGLEGCELPPGVQGASST